MDVQSITKYLWNFCCVDDIFIMILSYCGFLVFFPLMYNPLSEALQTGIMVVLVSGKYICSPIFIWVHWCYPILVFLVFGRGSLQVIYLYPWSLVPKSILLGKKTWIGWSASSHPNLPKVQVMLRQAMELNFPTISGHLGPGFWLWPTQINDKTNISKKQKRIVLSLLGFFLYAAEFLKKLIG